jgi:hypothetical protein
MTVYRKIMEYLKIVGGKDISGSVDNGLRADAISSGKPAEKQYRDRVEQGYYCNTAKHYNRTHCKSGIGKLIRHTSYNIFNPFKAMVHYRKC